MTEPKETNQDINEELSTDELKSVSGGGLASSPIGKKELNWGEVCDVGASVRKAEGSGSGMTLKDWKKTHNIKLAPGEF